MANFTRVESPAEKRLKKTAKDLEKARGLSRLSPHGEGAKEAREAYRQGIGGQPTVNLPTLFGDQPSSSDIPSFRSQPPAVPPTSAGTRFTDLEAFAPAQAPRPSIGTRFTDLEAFAPPTIETKEERKTRFQNEMGARRDVELEQIRGFSASGGQSGRVAFKEQIELGTRLFEAEDRRQNPGDQPAFGFDTAPEQLEDVLAEVAAQGGPQQLLNALGLIETIDQSGISLFLSLIPGPQRERAREMREAGFGTFEAAMRAYDEIPRKARVRLAEDLLFSPLNLLPVIGFPAALAKGTMKAMQTLRRVGQAIIDDTGKPVAQTLRRVGQPTTDALRTPAAPGVPRMADDLGPIGFEDAPVVRKGPEVIGRPNLIREDVEAIATGSEAMKSRLGLEVRRGGLDEDVAETAVEFLELLPQKYTDDLASSFFADPQGGLLPGTAGFYSRKSPLPDTPPAIINIIKSITNRSSQADRIIVHEISHHLEQFVPSADARRLVTQYQKDLATNGADVIAEANRLRAVNEAHRLGRGRALTAAEEDLVHKAYRFEGGFQEWFAEVITDKALRDIFMEVPAYRSLIQRALDRIKAIAVAVRDMLLRRGRKDEAERVYQKLVGGKFSPEDRRVLDIDDLFAITLPHEAGSARIRKFLDPALQRRSVALKAKADAAGMDYVALAGQRDDEFFIALEIPKVGDKKFLRLIDELPLGSAERTAAIDLQSRSAAAETLLFRGFDDVDQFFVDFLHKPPTIESPLRTGPVKKLYEAGAPGAATRRAPRGRSAAEGKEPTAQAIQARLGVEGIDVRPGGNLGLRPSETAGAETFKTVMKVDGAERVVDIDRAGFAAQDIGRGMVVHRAITMAGEQPILVRPARYRITHGPTGLSIADDYTKPIAEELARALDNVTDFSAFTSIPEEFTDQLRALVRLADAGDLDGLKAAAGGARATPAPAPTVARAAVGPREQNFAQFLRERGVTDPGLDQGPQSPAGRISAAAKRAFDKRRDAEFARFGEAQDEYQQLVNDGSIVDPSGMVRPVAQADPNIAKAALLRQRADELERLADGGMRPRVNRAEAAKIRAEAEALEPTAVPGAVPGAAVTPQAAPTAARKPRTKPKSQEGVTRESPPAEQQAAHVDAGSPDGVRTVAEAPPSAAATVVEPAFDDLTPWYKVDFSAAESSDDLANGYASRAIWDVTTPRKRPPTVQAAERARGQAARALGSYPDVPPILARRGEVEAFLATQGKGMGDIDVAAQQVMAARTFLEGRYRSAKAGWERVVRNAEEAVKRARAELGQATEATVEAAPRAATVAPADAPGAARVQPVTPGVSVRVSNDVIQYEGRDIVRVELPDGRAQPFYLRTGRGGGGDAPNGGGGAGHWVPFDGIDERRAWFVKTEYVSREGPLSYGQPLYRYGTQALKDIGLALDDSLGNVPKGRLIREGTEGIAETNEFLAKKLDEGVVPPPPPSPPPPPPPPPPGMPLPDGPALTLKRVQDSLTKGERIDQVALRLHEAAVNQETRRAALLVQEVNDKLKALGIGVQRGPSRAIRESEIPVMDELMNALHNPSKVVTGEVRVPDGFQETYDRLRSLTDWEEAARLDFNPEMATVEDYFFRGWKPPEDAFIHIVQGGKGKLVPRPDFMKPRVGATYEELRALGFEPLYWNPAEQWRVSRLQGVRYRQQMQLVEVLKVGGGDMIKPFPTESGIPNGFRVPEVGPAFEGKPVATINEAGEPQVLYTGRWIVDNRVANTLEGMYGKRTNELTSMFTPGGRRFNLGSVIDWFTFVPKRFKLFGSFFQQQDFINRAGMGGWQNAVDALLHGHPIEAATSVVRIPRTAWRILEANFRPSVRRTLAEAWDDTTPLVNGHPDLHLKKIGEAGLSTADYAILPSNLDEVVRAVARENGLHRIKAVGRAIEAIEAAMRRGLFHGTYPAAMMNDIRYNIAPMLARQHPGMNDDALASLIATFTNVKYSTLPRTAALIQNQIMNHTLRRLLFSLNESEGLLRQAFGVVRGPGKLFWTEHWVGGYLYFMTLAEIIHYTTMGEHLPLDRFSPISTSGHNWGPLPFGYNRDFAAPTIAIEGRNAVAEVTMDLVGQMDTAFRLLDPVSFVTSRESVPVRAISNQISGQNFFGQAIDDVGPGGWASRSLQLAQDLFAPIGAGQAGLEILREKQPMFRDLISEQEGRLGTAGLAFQATGINLRTERTVDLIVRTSQELGFMRPDGQPVENIREISRSQDKRLAEERPEVAQELQRRTETQAARGDEYAIRRLAHKEIETDRLKAEEALVVNLVRGQIEGENRSAVLHEFASRYGKIQVEMAGRREQLFKGIEGRPPEDLDPYELAIDEYYDAYDKATRADRSLDFDVLDTEIDKAFASWTQSQSLYVIQNTGLTEHPQLIQEWLNARRQVSQSGYWDSNDRQAFRDHNPTIDALLVQWSGYTPRTMEGDRAKAESLAGVR